MYEDVRRRPPVDSVLILLLLPILAVGIVFVFSASYPRAGLDPFHVTGGDSYYYLKRQALYAVVGLLCMAAASLVNMQWLRRHAYHGYWLAVALLLLVLLFGEKANEARRWLVIGPVRFQPSELARLLGVVAVARFIAERPKAVNTLPGVVAASFWAGLLALLILLEPHLGGALVIAAILFAMLQIGGARLRHLAVPMVVALLAAVILVFGFGYKKNRIVEGWRVVAACLGIFSSHKEDRILKDWQSGGKVELGVGYQATHAKMAFGSGGLGGRGFGESREKHFYLPEPHTDCILAVLGEEMGVFGSLGVLLLFGFLIWRGFHIAKGARDSFQVLLASGLTLMIAIPAVVNIASVTGILPTVGLPLPLVSYGGSSLICSLAGIGLLLNVSRGESLSLERAEERRLRRDVLVTLEA